MVEPVSVKQLAQKKYNKKAYAKKKEIKGNPRRCNVKGCRWWAMPNTYKCLNHYGIL